MPRVKIGPALPDREKLDAEIARLRDLNVGQLRSRWHTAFGRPAPAHLARHLLFRSLAYRVFDLLFGEGTDFGAATVVCLIFVCSRRPVSRKNLLKEILHGDPGTLIGLLVVGGRRRAVFRHEPVGEGV